MTKSKTVSTTLFIKNMVCNRCILVVRNELESLGSNIKNIALGEVELYNTIGKPLLDKIRSALIANGFELIEDRKANLVNQIKGIIIKTIYDEKNVTDEHKNFSEIIEKSIGRDYHYLSALFSSLESITIEQYIILQKIERAKELLKYGELTLSEIAYKLGYSSVQHLSNQFKKVTGFSASQFKKITTNMRKPIDKIK